MTATIVAAGTELLRRPASSALVVKSATVGKIRRVAAALDDESHYQFLYARN